MAVFCQNGVRSDGENALRHVHDGGEGGHGEENEASSDYHHVTGVQNDGHGEEDVGEQPAAKRSPAEGITETGPMSSFMINIF